MNNFEYYNPTKLIFGEGTISKLIEEISGKYKKILLHYGKDSIKKYGVYDQVVNAIKEAKAEFVELSGVEPNPKLSLIREGIKICKEEGVDFILSVGGGSVIDSAKAISVGAVSDTDIWKFFIDEEITNALPTGVVLTIPATGSESSPSSIVTNEEGLLKRGIESDILRPVFAILDPALTVTLPNYQTFAGVVDILSHIFERYFTNTEYTDLTNGLCEATIKTVIKNAHILKDNPQDINARGEIMLSGTIAHNGILGLGRQEDWGSHRIGHEITALYGTTHGVTLSIILPAWMKYVYKTNLKRFKEFGINVFGISELEKSDEEIALESILELEKFFQSVDMPIRLSEIGIDEKDFKEMANKCTMSGSVGRFKVLCNEDVIEILKLAL